MEQDEPSDSINQAALDHGNPWRPHCTVIGKNGGDGAVVLRKLHIEPISFQTDTRSAMRNLVLFVALVVWPSAFSLAAEMENWRFLNPSPGAYESDMPPPQRPVPRSQFSEALAPAASFPVVRLAYIIPSNRTAQTNAVAKMRTMIVANQKWYRDQLDRHGFGPKTFRFETEADGVTPLVHVVNVPDTDVDLRGDLWGRTISAASGAGITVWASGELWVLVPEAHIETSDGSVTGGAALGASFGSGNDPGVTLLGSNALALWDSSFEKDDRAYHNLFLSDIGPYAMKQDVSFAWYEGTTFSSIASSLRGASAHEMGHAFGLPHDFRNDDNFHGNLMGNGLRGIRGNFFPARYPADHAQLTYVAALILNVSRYFNAESAETTKPALTIATSGAVTIVGGKISIAFNASDTSGLVGAWLTLDGNLIAEIPLSGTSVTTQFSVPYFTAGAANNYSIAVYDRFGNKQSADTTITPTSGPNRAPQPFLKVQSPVPLAGETVVLDASASTDPESSSDSLLVEWDLDGNGIFDTAPSTTKTYSLPVTAPGNRYVAVRVTDPSGASAVSTRVAIHAHRPSLTFVPVAPALTFELSWLSKIGVDYQIQSSPVLSGWSSAGFPPIRGDAGFQRRNITPSVGQGINFYHATITNAAN